MSTGDETGRDLRIASLSCHSPILNYAIGAVELAPRQNLAQTRRPALSKELGKSSLANELRSWLRSGRGYVFGTKNKNSSQGENEIRGEKFQYQNSHTWRVTTSMVRNSEPMRRKECSQAAWPKPHPVSTLCTDSRIVYEFHFLKRQISTAGSGATSKQHSLLAA